MGCCATARFPVCLVAATLTLAGAGTAFSQEVMYGSTAQSSGGSIVIVDPTDASYVTVGDPIDDGALPAIAMDSSGRLFVSNNIRVANVGKVGFLRRVDPSTGEVLETIGGIKDGADEQPLRISSMEFSPTDGQLFGVIARDNIEGAPGGKEGSIVTISTTTAVATVIGSTGLPRGGLAFRPDGRLYLTTADRVAELGAHVIARIDPATGAVIGSPVELSMDMEIEGMAFRPSDGVLFANYADGSQMYTIDPDTGAQAEIGTYSGGQGHVADLTFRPGAVGLTGGLLLPEKIRVKVNTKKPTRSSLAAKLRLDSCCSGNDVADGGRLEINGTVWDLAGAKINKRRTRLVFKGDGAKVVLRTGLGGTSRGALSVKLKGDLTGIAASDGDVTMRLVSGPLDVSATATLVGTRFKLRRGDAVQGVALVPLSVRGRVDDPDRSAVKAKLGVGAIPDGPGAPDVTISIGGFTHALSGDDAAGSGDRLAWSARDDGVRSLVLDTSRREISVDLDDVTLGYTEGPLTVRVKLGTGEEHAIAIVPRTRGSSFKY